MNEIDYYLKRARNTGEEINAVAWSEYRGLGNISIPDSSDKVKLITEEMVAKKYKQSDTFLESNKRRLPWKKSHIKRI